MPFIILKENINYKIVVQKLIVSTISVLHGWKKPKYSDEDRLWLFLSLSLSILFLSLHSLSRRENWILISPNLWVRLNNWWQRQRSRCCHFDSSSNRWHSCCCCFYCLVRALLPVIWSPSLFFLTNWAAARPPTMFIPRFVFCVAFVAARMLKAAAAASEAADVAAAVANKTTMMMMSPLLGLLLSFQSMEKEKEVKL